MATRSFIATKENESFKGIYCHCDGYPSHMQPVLIENYDTYEKVDTLIEMGDASYIDKTLEESVFYHRDRKEALHFTNGVSLEALINTAKNAACEYLYLFVGNKWITQKI